MEKYEKINPLREGKEKDMEEVRRIAQNTEKFNKDDKQEIVGSKFGGINQDMSTLIEAMLTNAKHQTGGKESELAALDDAHTMSQPHNELRKLAELKRLISIYKIQTDKEREAFEHSEDFMGIDPKFLKGISESAIKELEKKIEEKEIEMHWTVQNN